MALQKRQQCATENRQSARKLSALSMELEAQAEGKTPKAKVKRSRDGSTTVMLPSVPAKVKTIRRTITELQKLGKQATLEATALERDIALLQEQYEEGLDGFDEAVDRNFTQATGMIQAGVFHSDVTVDYFKEDRQPTARDPRRKTVMKEAMLSLQLNLDYKPVEARHQRLLFVIKALLGMVHQTRSLQHQVMMDLKTFAIPEVAEYVRSVHYNFARVKT